MEPHNKELSGLRDPEFRAVQLTSKSLSRVSHGDYARSTRVLLRAYWVYFPKLLQLLLQAGILFKIIPCPDNRSSLNQRQAWPPFKVDMSSNIQLLLVGPALLLHRHPAPPEDEVRMPTTRARSQQPLPAARPLLHNCA